MDGRGRCEKRFCEVSAENEVFRFDAEYFDKECLFLLDKIRNGRYCTVETNFDVSKLAGFEYTEYFTPDNMNRENSYIALTSRNIQQNRLFLNDYITIDKKIADAYLTRSKLKPGDVVMSYTGEYRRALTLFDRDFQLGPNVCRLTPIGNEIDSSFLSVFFNSKSGQKILDREKTLSAQPTVSMSRIRKIPVPVFCELQELVSNLVEENYRLQCRSEEKYREAAAVLDQYLNVDEYNITNITVKTIKDSFLSTGRLDAEYYQDKYQTYEARLNVRKTVASLCHLYDESFVPCEDTQYRYIELANVGTFGNISDIELFNGYDLPSRARRKVRKGQVIVSSVEGSLQRCALITSEFDNALCSSGFYVLDSDYINSETLLVLFKSKLVQALLKRRCSGTILTGITRDELLSMPLPEIEVTVQSVIAEKVRGSFALRKRAEALLECAKQAIDIAIEQSEGHAIVWLRERRGEWNADL